MSLFYTGRLRTLVTFYLIFLATFVLCHDLSERRPDLPNPLSNLSTATTSSQSTTSNPPTTTTTPPNTTSIVDPPPKTTSTSTPPDPPSTVVTTSSSSSSSVSSTSTLSLSTSVIPVIAPTTRAESTLYVTPIATITDGGDPTDTPVTTDNSAASPKPFLQNTAAVAATFTILGIVGLGLIFGVGTYALRRRRRRLENEEFFEKYPEPNSNDDNISTLDIVAPARPDAYPDRNVHYGSSSNSSTSPDMYQSFPDSHGQQAPTEHYTSQQVYGEAQQATPNYGVGDHYQYEYNVAPGQGNYPAGTAPYARAALGRDSYQQSIDSFYGGAVAR